jgi:hypothetical protein
VLQNPVINARSRCWRVALLTERFPEGARGGEKIGVAA